MDIKIQYKQELEQQQKQAKPFHLFILVLHSYLQEKRNKELETWLVSNGATIGKTVNSKTSFVVTDKIESNSSKIIKANSMNIPVITMEDLLKDTVK